jgi:hypothetical protein
MTDLNSIINPTEERNDARKRGFEEGVSFAMMVLQRDRPVKGTRRNVINNLLEKIALSAAMCVSQFGDEADE